MPGRNATWRRAIRGTVVGDGSIAGPMEQDRRVYAGADRRDPRGKKNGRIPDRGALKAHTKLA